MGRILYLYGAKHGGLNFVLKISILQHLFEVFVSSVWVVERWGKDTFNKRFLKMTPLESLTVSQGFACNPFMLCSALELLWER